MDKNGAKFSPEIKSEDDEIDLLELIGIMWVYKWWIAGITGLAAAAVILYTIFFSTAVTDSENIKTYTSTAVVLVNEASGVGIPFSMYEGRFDISSLLNSTSLLTSYGALAEGAYNLLQEKFEFLITDYAAEERKILEKKLRETREEFISLEYKISEFQIEYGLLGASDREAAKNLPKEKWNVHPSYLKLIFLK
ncbi:MAG: Wzz/FepE/Etk N-terminal domain-containing protein [Spirochaetota bacterium]|nr:Wzz/FepE/Etk N-terminal domain-containing protein [Spirochaetota bacterium]